MFGAENVTARRVGSSVPYGPRFVPDAVHPAHDVLVVGDQKLDLEAKIGKGRPEVRGGLLLPFRSGERIGRAEVVAHVVPGEHLAGRVEIALDPDLFVEPPDERLVLLCSHARRSYESSSSRNVAPGTGLWRYAAVSRNPSDS